MRSNYRAIVPIAPTLPGVGKTGRGYAHSMSRATLHEIIVNSQHQYVVWPARKPLPLGWNYVGRSGSKEDLEFYLREMFVETMPVPLAIQDGRQPESRWG